MNYAIIAYIMGRVLQVEAIFMILPFFAGLLYKEEQGIAFLVVGLITFFVGFLLAWKKPKSSSFYAREGMVTVSLSWVLLGLIGAVPFVLNGDIPNVIDAIFETVSGFTTTGASVVRDVESLSHASLLWRSFTHWIGGMGVLVFVLSILPLAGAQNIYIMKAESPGPSVGKLVPKIKSTAAYLYKIYFGMTLLQFLLLLLGDLDVFSAFNLSIATAGTGGFALLRDGCNSYSTYVQVVITIFMILFGINFSVYYLILCRKFKQALFCEEMRWYLLIIAASIMMITINVADRFVSIGQAVKHVSFTVASIISSTGFATVDYNEWPTFSKTIIVGLMFIGACAGSTGGGLKVSRIVIYLKTVKKAIVQYLHPKCVKVVKFEGKQVEHETIRGVNTFLVTFVFLFAISVLLISLDNFSFTTNFTAVATTLNNMGPGLEMVGPTGSFADFSVLSKIVLILDMLLGRLEIFPLLILFAPGTYKR